MQLPTISLEMYVDGKLLDAIAPCPSDLRSRRTQYIADLKTMLLKKHRALLSRYDSSPTFILSGIPSQMNLFVPLPAFNNRLASEETNVPPTRDSRNRFPSA